MRRYIHERPGWPEFTWDGDALSGPLASLRHRQGRLLGFMEALGLPLQQRAVLETLTTDVVKSSQIEGELLDIGQVRSSLARHLGVDIGALSCADRHIDGVVEMTLDATLHYARPLTIDRLLGWHAALFPTGRSGMLKIRAGAWRDDRTGPMQVVSGPMGRERVHVEAPRAANIPRDMRAFLAWLRKPDATDPVLVAALAHFWFVTIHPFDDGSGRIARAIADLALARSEATPRRFYSMSAQIQCERRAYYDILEHTQKGTLDITPWMQWFIGCLGRAIDSAQTTLAAVLQKAKFWQMHGAAVNDRQRLMLNRLLDGFEGSLTTSKWAQLADCSQDTALRDIAELVERGALARGAEGGRSTKYVLADPEPRKNDLW